MRALTLVAALAACSYPRSEPPGGDDSDAPLADAPPIDAPDGDALDALDAPDASDAGGAMLVASEIPLRIVAGTTVTVRLTVQGTPSEQVTWSITSGGGAFVPSGGTVTVQGTGLGVIAVQYTAPGSAADLQHTLTLDDGAVHQDTFATLVRTLSPIGQHVSFPDSAGLQVAGGYLYGQRVTLGSEVVLLRLGLFADTGTQSGRLALYRDAGGVPGALVAFTATATIGTNRTELDVVTPVLLDPGDYWLLGNFATGVQVRRGASADVTQAYVGQQIGDPLPTDVAGAMTLTDRALNYFGMVAP